MAWNNFVNSLTKGIPHSDKRFLGLKIALFGYLIAMAGLLLLFGGFGKTGQLTAYVGAAVGAIGILVQIVILLYKLK